MKPASIVSYSTEELKHLKRGGGDQTDWQRVRLMKDEDIQYDDDSPPITAERFAKATAPKQNLMEITLSNTLLRSYMEAHTLKT